MESVNEKHLLERKRGINKSVKDALDGYKTAHDQIIHGCINMPPLAFTGQLANSDIKIQIKQLEHGIQTNKTGFCGPALV